MPPETTPDLNGSPTTPPAPPAPGTPPAVTPPAPGTPDGVPDTVPLAAHTALRTRAQTAEAELAALKTAATEAATATAAEQGRYKELYEGVKDKADAYDVYTASVATSNAARVEALDDTWRATIPAVVMTDPLALKAFLDNTQALRVPPAPTDATRPAGTMTGGGPPPPPDTIPQAAIDDAARAGKEPAEWWAIMKHSKRYATK